MESFKIWGIKNFKRWPIFTWW